MIRTTPWRAALAATLLILPLAACGSGSAPEAEHADEHGGGEEYERGPHGGRLLEDRPFALEMTIFEDGQPPQFRVYPRLDGKPLDPHQVQLAVTLKRLGGKVDRFAFRPQGDFLAGLGTVEEPHSFDVEVVAVHAGKRSRWVYPSYEGRTTIAADAARDAGIRVERAGPANLDETRELIGTVALAPTARAEVRARFPGRVVSVSKAVGDRVARGEVLARVESNESLQTYAVTAAMSGVIAERATNAGDVAGEGAMFVIVEPAATTVEFHVFPRDLEKVRAGQRVYIETLDGDPVATTTLASFLPEADGGSGTAVIRASLPNPTGIWRPGMALRGRAVVDRTQVPLAVRTKALQRFRDFTVVYAAFGNDYEVRMLELGRRTPEWTEVTSGLTPGTSYVTDGAFVVRADVEKSGAGHDH